MALDYCPLNTFARDGIREGGNTIWGDTQQTGSSAISSSASDLIGSSTGDFRATGPTSSSTVPIGAPRLENRSISDIRDQVSYGPTRTKKDNYTDANLTGNVELGLTQYLDGEHGPVAGSPNSNSVGLYGGIRNIHIAGDNSQPTEGYIEGRGFLRLAGGEQFNPQVANAAGQMVPRYETKPTHYDKASAPQTVSLNGQQYPLTVNDDGTGYITMNGEQYQVANYATDESGQPKKFMRESANSPVFGLTGKVGGYFPMNDPMNTNPQPDVRASVGAEFRF